MKNPNMQAIFTYIKGQGNRKGQRNRQEERKGHRRKKGKKRGEGEREKELQGEERNTLRDSHLPSLLGTELDEGSLAHEEPEHVGHNVVDDHRHHGDDEPNQACKKKFQWTFITSNK